MELHIYLFIVNFDDMLKASTTKHININHCGFDVGFKPLACTDHSANHRYIFASLKYSLCCLRLHSG